MGGRVIPRYLMEMPARILFGSCADLEAWLVENSKQRPTLWDLANARAVRDRKKRGRR